MLRKLSFGVLFAALLWLVPTNTFAQGNLCNPISTEPVVAADTQETQEAIEIDGISLVVSFTTQDCEMLGDYFPYPNKYPEVGVSRWQILRKFEFTAKDVEGASSINRVSGTFFMPIGKDTGTVFHNYEYGSQFEDTVHDPSFWNTRNGKTVPSIKFQETMVVHTAYLALMAREAAIEGFEINYSYMDLGAVAFGFTHPQNRSTFSCDLLAPTVVLEPNPDELTGNTTVGYKRMMYLLQFAAHESYHGFSAGYNQALATEEALGYGMPEESFAEAFAVQILDKLRADSGDFQTLWNFNFFKGADIAQLKTTLKFIEDVRKGYFASRWSDGYLENYVMWPVVDYHFTNMAKVVENLATHCHENLKVTDVANDYGISVGWESLVTQQVADCLYEGAGGEGLLRNHCKVQSFTPGVQTLQSGYLCVDSIDDSHRVSRLTGVGHLWYLFGTEYGSWDDWFRANSTDFFPSNHTNQYVPVGGTRFCLVAGANAAIYNLVGDPVVLDEVAFLPLVQR